MTLNRLAIFLCILSLMSCGLREVREVDENVLLGTWKFTSIVCMADEDAEDIVEDYTLPSSLEIILTFERNRIDYTATGDCSTSSTGFYQTEFNGTSTGEVDFFDVVTGANTCTESLTDGGPSSVGAVDITTTLVDINSQKLNWLVSNDRELMNLEYFSSFTGSSDSNGCAGACYCYAILTKQ